jgi:hypothetical protein
MVIGAITNLILMLFHILLAYITFKELSNKNASHETHKRILLKWITSTVFFSSFWIFEFVFYLFPTSFVKLPLGLWLLMPQFYGEYTIYNMFAEVFDNLEFYIRYVRNAIASGLFGLTFKICASSFDVIKKFIPNDKLKDFQNRIRFLDKELNEEMRLRKTIMQQMNRTSKPPRIGELDDHLRDSTVIDERPRQRKNLKYFKPSTGQIFTPVGMFTRTQTAMTNDDDIVKYDSVKDDLSRTETDVRQRVKAGLSKTTQKNRLGGKGTSSYIDPGLAAKMGNTDFIFEDKDEYTNKTSTKKKN